MSLLGNSIMMQKASAPASVTVFYEYGYPGTCATRTWNVKKNGVIQNSGSGNTSVSGSFTTIIGDVISISVTSGASGFSCSGATTSIQKNFADVAFDTQGGFGVTSTVSYTIDSLSAAWNMYGGLVA